MRGGLLQRSYVSLGQKKTFQCRLRGKRFRATMVAFDKWRRSSRAAQAAGLKISQSAGHEAPNDIDKSCLSESASLQNC